MKETIAYEALAEAIAQAPSIPPCQTSDPEVWYSDITTGVHEYRMAKKLCGVCPVRTECLTYAMKANERFGIWGGLTSTERQALRGQGRGRPLKSRRR